MSWKIDLSEWTVYQMLAWYKATAASDIRTLNDLMSRAIVTWEFECDPGVLEDYMTLKLPQYGKALRYVSEALATELKRQTDSINDLD